MSPRKSCWIRSAFWILVFSSLDFSQTKGGRWQFEGDGTDSAEWDLASDGGRFLNGAGCEASGSPPEGEACLFLDTGLDHNCFLVEDSPDLDFDNENIAVSAWVFPTVLNDVHFILSKGDQYPNPKTTNYAVRISTGRNLEFLIRDSNNKAQTVASQFTIPPDQWTFVAVFYEFSSGRVRLWNRPDSAAGELVDFNKAFFSNDDPLCIGSWYTSDPAVPTAKDFKGRIDDVRIGGRLEDVFPAVASVRNRRSQASQKQDRVFEVFPNPVVLSRNGGEVSLRFDRDTDEETVVCLVDILGREIHRLILPRVGLGRIVRFNPAEADFVLSTGVYLLRITNRRFSAVQKIFIQR
jgi:hypothetical protein